MQTGLVNDKVLLGGLIIGLMMMPLLASAQSMIRIKATVEFPQAEDLMIDYQTATTTQTVSIKYIHNGDQPLRCWTDFVRGAGSVERSRLTMLSPGDRKTVSAPIYSGITRVTVRVGCQPQQG